MTSKLDPQFNDPRFSTRVEITVPFHDADSMGVVWHGNYFRYLEVAREQLLKQFDYGTVRCWREAMSGQSSIPA